MDETNIERALADMFLGAADNDEELIMNALFNLGWEVGIEQVNTNSECGLLTNNKGVVINLQDGSEFQITIVQSKYGRE